MIKEWLATRPQFIEHRGMPVNDTRLFPFDNHVASLMFANGLKRAGLVERDSSTNRYRVHIHVLRKFFRTRLGAVMNSDFTEALIGHEDHLKEVYARYSIEDIAKEYKKSEHALAVFPNDTTVKTLTEDVTMLKGIVAKFFQIGENAQKIMK